MILFVDLKESIWATFWVVMISVFMFLILVSIFYILLHLVSKRIGLRQSAVQMVKRASWSAFPLAAVGVISGYMTGASREPAVDALIPAVLTFLGGAAIYFSRGHPVRSYVMGFVVFVFSVNLLLGITLGSHGRARAEASDVRLARILFAWAFVLLAALVTVALILRMAG